MRHMGACQARLCGWVICGWWVVWVWVLLLCKRQMAKGVGCMYCTTVVWVTYSTHRTALSLAPSPVVTLTVPLSLLVSTIVVIQ